MHAKRDPLLDEIEADPEGRKRLRRLLSTGKPFLFKANGYTYWVTTFSRDEPEGADGGAGCGR